MNEERIEITSYNEESCGKTFKSTKYVYKWEFYYNNELNVVELKKSTLSGKLRIFFNNHIIHYEQK
jgi:hypothetical protein